MISVGGAPCDCICSRRQSIYSQRENGVGSHLAHKLDNLGLGLLVVFVIACRLKDSKDMRDGGLLRLVARAFCGRELWVRGEVRRELCSWIYVSFVGR